MTDRCIFSYFFKCFRRINVIYIRNFKLDNAWWHSYFMSFDESFLISLGFTCSTGFTLTEGLKEEVELPLSGVPSAPGDDVVATAPPPDPNLCTSLGVLGPGDRIGTTWDRGAARTSGSGLGFGTGARSPAACGVFFNVSVSAAKLSALESEEEGATYSSEVVDLLPTESVDGDLDFLGLGAGTGGLLASAPAGRSITRSGV